jgi:hypothetical protein
MQIFSYNSTKERALITVLSCYEHDKYNVNDEDASPQSVGEALMNTKLNECGQVPARATYQLTIKGTKSQNSFSVNHIVYFTSIY